MAHPLTFVDNLYLALFPSPARVAISPPQRHSVALRSGLSHRRFSEEAARYGVPIEQRSSFSCLRCSRGKFSQVERLVSVQTKVGNTLEVQALWKELIDVTDIRQNS